MYSPSSLPSLGVHPLDKSLHLIVRQMSGGVGVKKSHTPSHVDYQFRNVFLVFTRCVDTQGGGGGYLCSIRYFVLKYSYIFSNYKLGNNLTLIVKNRGIGKKNRDLKG